MILLTISSDKDIINIIKLILNGTNAILLNIMVTYTDNAVTEKSNAIR